MKELILQKGEEIICYVYENGKQIDKFKIKLNCNLQPYRVSDWKEERLRKVNEVTEFINKNY